MKKITKLKILNTVLANYKVPIYKQHSMTLPRFILKKGNQQVALYYQAKEEKSFD